MKNLIYIGIIIIAALVIFGGSDDSPSSPSTQTSARDNSTMAYVQAKNFVKPVLKSPSTADFPFLGSGTKVGENTYKVTSYVDAQNSFGAAIRNDFSITLEFTGGDSANQGNWRVIEFIFDGETLVEKQGES